jgi:DNA-3-methyladenine glycosylase II
MRTFTLHPRGPFSLAASTRFLEGFTPAAYAGTADSPLELAFPAEGSWQTVGVRVRQGASASAGVTGEIVHPAAMGPDLIEPVGRQVARILSLDVDGAGFTAVGERDPVVAALQRRFPGLRPVGFWSPYEAAAWTIIGHRIRIRQAAAIKAAMARELGEPVRFGGTLVHAFPAPDRLAELVLLRGACDPDALARHEPRLARAVGRAYGLPGPATESELLEISENWRPYRTWVTVLLRTQLEDETGEISGRGRPQ